MHIIYIHTYVCHIYTYTHKYTHRQMYTYVLIKGVVDFIFTVTPSLKKTRTDMEVVDPFTGHIVNYSNNLVIFFFIYLLT